MSTSEIPRSELIRAMVEVGNLLTGPKPLAERMLGLCASAAYVLRADQFVVLTIDGDCYRGAYQFGLPPALAEGFSSYIVPRSKPIVAAIEACDSYLLFNQANDGQSRLGRAPGMAGVASVIIVPFTHPDGEPLGYLSASYEADKPDVTAGEGELAMGMARIAQTTVLRELETQRRREVSQAMLQVADSERRRLSRDIHDDPLQQILGVRIGLESFRERLTDPAHLSELDRFVEQCRSASASLREVMLRTHPNASELADLEQVLQSLVRRREFGAAVELDFSDQRSETAPSYLVPALNRVAEQAARNSLRHAAATKLTVNLSDRDGGTLLTIDDDGAGFDPATVERTRLGLVSMRERTELLGGTFTLTSTAGNGTQISAWFPHTRLDIDSDEG